MKQYIFTIYDQKAKAHLTPFFLPEKGMASRTFADCVNKPDHQFNLHPEDYTLMCIGTFDETLASITIAETPEVLGTGVQFVEQTTSPE